MKLKTILMLAFAFATVTLNTACPSDIAKNIAEEDKLVKEYDAKVKEANALADDLRINYDVSVSSLFTLSPDWKSMKAPKRAEIKGKLTHYVELVSRLSELADHKNVKDHVKAGEPEKLSQFNSNAKYFLKTLQTCEAPGGDCK